MKTRLTAIPRRETNGLAPGKANLPEVWLLQADGGFEMARERSSARRCVATCGRKVLCLAWPTRESAQDGDIPEGGMKPLTIDVTFAYTF
jgi:hypothetical protein